MLLSSKEFSNKLERSLAASSERIIVLSAFIKSHALLWLLGQTQVRDISVVARWQPHDLACGASDIECFKLCRERGIPFGVSLNLHGKVYCVDEHILVGSANLTSKGMALSNRPNSEFGIGFVGGVADRTKIDEWLRQVTWLDDELVMSMMVELEKSDKNLTSDNSEWPAFILEKLATPITHLWVHELPFTVPEALLECASDDDSCRHDLTLLNINPREVELEGLLVAFKKTNAFCWLSELVESENSVSFGKITSELHDAVLDDPTPYRQEIKSLVKNLLGWATHYPDYFSITRPRHSIVIRRVNTNYT